MSDAVEIQNSGGNVFAFRRPAEATFASGDVASYASDPSAPLSDTTMSVTREELQLSARAAKAEQAVEHEKLRADFAELRGDTNKEFEAIRGEMRTEFTAVRGEMKVGFEALRAEMHKASSDNIKWIIGTAIALASILITVLGVLIKSAEKPAPAQVPANQAPIIISVPVPTTGAPATAPAQPR